jgi:hypothetical protein
MLLANIILLGIGLWAAWTGFKAFKQVYGIALLFTGLIVVVWSMAFAPLWFQISVEVLLIALSHFLSNLYTNRSKSKALMRRCRS